MQDIYILSGTYEQTKPDKKPLNLVYVTNVIHYVVGGQGYFNGQLLKKGQGFICPKDVYCSYYPDPTDPWAYIWISLVGLDVTPLLTQYAASGYVFDFHCDADFPARGQLLLNPVLLSDSNYAASAFQIFYTHHADYQKKTLPLTDNIAWKAKEYILHNYYKNIRMEDIATQLHISRAYLRNIFFESEGISPKSYLIDLRLNQAKLLLKNGLSIKETASSVGYEDAFQFSKIFKKHIGCSPAEYRKIIQ